MPFRSKWKSHINDDEKFFFLFPMLSMLSEDRHDVARTPCLSCLGSDGYLYYHMVAPAETWHSQHHFSPSFRVEPDVVHSAIVRLLQ
jgi:hypothetical protein